MYIHRVDSLVDCFSENIGIMYEDGSIFERIKIFGIEIPVTSKTGGFGGTFAFLKDSLSSRIFSSEGGSIHYHLLMKSEGWYIHTYFRDNSIVAYDEGRHKINKCWFSWNRGKAIDKYRITLYFHNGGIVYSSVEGKLRHKKKYQNFILEKFNIKTN